MLETQESKVIRLRKGLDLPIDGRPEQRVDDSKSVPRVAIIAADYLGLRPAMRVEVGQAVRRGEVLFEDKRNPGVQITSPGAGVVTAINRGERRALISVVIELNERERAGKPTEEDFVPFPSYTGKDITGLSRDAIGALLLESGLWTSFRTRPFSKIPHPNTVPHSIFVTAMDTNPLAPSVDVVLKEKKESFHYGLAVIAKLTDGNVFLCKAEDSHEVSAPPHQGIKVVSFAGPHPAGTPGVHIHFLDPVHKEKTVWHIPYQEVIAIGDLFRTGRLNVERVISLAGPSVQRPRLLRTRLGASTDALTTNELVPGEHRVISGSVLSGRTASGEIGGYLGRYHYQISVLPEGRERYFLGWMSPGINRFSVMPIYISRFFKNRLFKFTTNLNGGKRAMVPIGLYEKLMPMDILPTFLLRALLTNDLERAEELGCLELDEEDVALCSFVCPSKIDYGTALRHVLDTIEKEG